MKARRLTRQISIGGLMTALILVFMAIKQLLPTGDIALLALMSLCIAIAVIELGVKPAIVVFAAASLLSLAWPGIAAGYPFIVIFGPYPLIRAVIDRMFGRVTALLLKLLAGNILAVIAAAFFAWTAIGELADKYTLFWYLVPIGLQVIILVYDYALGLLIQVYFNRIKVKG